MRDLLGWNFSLGRWAGVHVRLHVFFILLAVLAVYFAAQQDDRQAMWYAASAVLILFVSVLAHEIGHCVTARRMGGAADQIVVWPLGGLVHVNVSHEPQEELVTAAAGPLVNLSICVLTLPGLFFAAGGDDVFKLLNPLAPPAGPVPPDTFGWHNALQLAFWTNWLLVLVNLLPAYPLDGGRILRAVLWSKKGYRTSVVLVSRVARVTAVAACVVAWLVHDSYSFAVLPLVLLGVFLFFSARQEVERLHDRDGDDALFGYDFSQGYTSLERNVEGGQSSPRSPGPVRQWLESRREARQKRQQLAEEDEERRVDEILARLHEAGADALTDEDRALLDRVSARYRNRQGG